MKKKVVLLTLFAGLLLSGCSSKADAPAVKQAQKEISLTVWHYYNGQQKSAFDRLVTKFNETVGKENGIYMEGHSKGEVTELEDAVIASVKREVGSDEMPDIFSSYADTAYEVEKAGLLADLDPYFTEEEQEKYVSSYIDEGRLGKNGELNIFPIAKSTEVLMLNQTLWDDFSAETGAVREDLKTEEGIVRVSEAYYNWTDAQTPDIPNDGRAFYGRDALANLFVIGSMQFGVEIFDVEGQKVTIHIDRDVFKKIWDNYYVPFVKGYFGAYGRFRSDDVKIGALAAYTGSVASAGYFPEQVEDGREIYPIECSVMPAPRFEGGKPYIIQQGAGMVVVKSTPEREAAAALFLKWFTDKKANMEFSISSGYLPVREDACKKEVLDEVIEEEKIEIQKKTYDTLLTAFQMVSENKMYTNKAFDGGTRARRILEYDLYDKAAADREAVKALLDTGLPLNEAVKAYISDEAFEQWFEAISQKLTACTEGQ